MSAAVDLNHLPDTYELPKARWRISVLLGVSMAFLLVGFAMAADHDTAAGWPVIVTFGVCFVVFTLAMFGRSSVTLDRDGFTHQTLFGSRRYAWRNVSECVAQRVGRSRMILFNDVAKVETPFSRFSRTMLRGYNTGIPAAFIGGKLDDASALMNAFRARALRRAA